MKFILKPSLEHIVLVKIVASLWNQKDVRNLIANSKVPVPVDIYSTDEEWEKIEQKVIEKVPHLSLPRLFQEKVSGFIKPIGLEISNFFGFHVSLNVYIYHLPDEFSWTPEGTVDKKKTVEALVKDESLDIPTRHMLACIHCFEDYIPKLWNIMSEELKEDFLESDWNTFATLIQDMTRRDVSDNAQINYKFEFKQCAIWGSKAAAEYFLQKLTPSEREESLVETAKRVTDADVLFFLLSEMDEQQQIEAFKNKPYKVLQHFLHWPLQSFFIEVAKCMWDFLPKEDYNMLLRKIIEKAANSYRDWNYENLFREFWQQSPNTLKSFITEEFDKSCLLLHLFRNKGKGYIRVILKDATFTAKEKFICSDQMNYFCQDCICDNEWDILENFIRECFTSKDEVLTFKEKFEKRIIYPYFRKDFATKKYKWDQLFYFSDDSVCKYDKRTADEGESSSCKRFCSLK